MHMRAETQWLRLVAICLFFGSISSTVLNQVRIIIVGSVLARLSFHAQHPTMAFLVAGRVA